MCEGVGLKVFSLCSGIGGLDLAVDTEVECELVAYAEIDKDAAAVMAYHWPESPNLGDITTIQWSEFIKLGIEMITAGYPCQPFSYAGQRKGTEDSRHIWPYIAEGIRVLRPRFVLLENVAGHRSKGFGTVLQELSEIGYVAAWVSLRAADVGAAHSRERVFILAADPDGLEVWFKSFRESQRSGATLSAQVGDSVADDAEIGDGVGFHGSVTGQEAESGIGGNYATTVAHSPSIGSQEGLRQYLRYEPQFAMHGEPDSGFVDWEVFGPAIERWEIISGRHHPSPLARGVRGGIVINSEFTEWFMGFPDGWVSDVPGIGHRAATKLCGNAVFPLQGAMAFKELLAMIESIA
jgi:DNA (cytosine-5)-methyltransferase 1